MNFGDLQLRAERPEQHLRRRVGESAAASLQPSDLLLRDTTILDEKPMNVVEMTIKRGGRCGYFPRVFFRPADFLWTVRDASTCA